MCRRCSCIDYLALAILVACERPRDNPAITDSARAVVQTVDLRCYRSPQSILLGPPVGRRNAGLPPGWIRLESIPSETTGVAELVDANGAKLDARWHRLARDSLLVIGADDFLRTEL